MTVAITHSFINAIPEGTTPGVVKPSAWNDNHVIKANGPSVLVAPPGTSQVVAESTPVTDGHVLQYSGGAIVWGATSLTNDQVTFAKMQNIPTDSLIGRDTAGTGDPESITLDATLEFTGGLAIRRAALTGDVTASAGSNATAIGANKVLDTMLRQSGALSVIGRSADSTGNVADIAAASDGQVLRRAASVLGFGALDLASANAITGDLPFANLTQGSARSVLGVTGNATADVASIQGTADQVLVVNTAGTALSFGTVATAGLTNDAVTYAKMQNISAQFRMLGRNSVAAGDPEEVTFSQFLDWVGSAADGDLLYRTGGAWARRAIGSTNDVLTVSGGLPTWAAPSSSGGITTIASGSFPAAATQSFTSIAATFAYLVLQITGASSNTATRHPRVQVSTNNGSSYDTTAGNYVGYSVDSAATVVVNAEATLLLGLTADQVAANTFTATVFIFGYQGGPNMHWNSRGSQSGSATTFFHGSGDYIGSTSAINALQILWNGSGNFDAGTYALYGVS